MNTHFLTLSEAIRSCEDRLFVSVQKATQEWIKSATEEEVKDAFFDYSVEDVESLQEAA